MSPIDPDRDRRSPSALDSRDRPGVSRTVAAVRRVLADLGGGALDLVLAPVCVCCGAPVPTRLQDRVVCPLCGSRIRTLPLPRCSRCWTPLPSHQAGVEGACRLCPELRPAIRAIRSACLLEGPARKLIHALKYQGWRSVVGPLGSRMARVSWPEEVEREVRLVVPVPIAPLRLRERGFNQAALLAEEIAALKGWKSRPALLQRTRSAGSQTTLHPGERRANVAGAFRVASEAENMLSSEHILLVDDVWTTGATARSCADTLLDAGARAVSVLTFARALPEFERHSRRLEAANH